MDRTQQKLSDVRKINQAALRLMKNRDLQMVFKVGLNEAKRLVQAKQGSIFLIKRNKLERVFSTVPKSEQINPRPRGLSWKVAATGLPRYITFEEFKAAHPEAERSKIGSLIILPLNYPGKTIGIMALQSAKELPQTDQENLTLFGAFVGLAIRNSQLYQQKNAAIAARDEFISLISHELKSPLSSITAYAQLILKKLKSKKTIKLNWLEAINRQANYLADMINSLFTISQISTGSFEYEYDKLDVIKLVSKLVKDSALLYPQKVVFDNQYTAAEPLTALVDETKFSIMIQNVLNNASKYSPEDSVITVHATLNKTHVIIAISDQGEGISDSQQKILFNKFERGTKKGAGLGLGLSIVKNVADNHDIDLTISSVRNEGTTVTFRIPLAL